MKKLLLLSAIVIGAASAAQAGGINLRFGFPLPAPPRLVITPPAPVVVAPRECVEPQVVVAPPVCETPVVVRDNCHPDRYVYRDYRRSVVDRQWDKHHRLVGRDYDDYHRRSR